MCLKRGNVLRDRYQIINKLGEGGSATTYLANDGLGNPEHLLCVVKEIPQPQSNDRRVLQEAQAQFEKEARTLKHLDNCARIPKLIDCFQKQGKFYLIQEYILGTPLNQELISGKRFEEKAVIDLLQDILSVLDFVHSQGIIHRDLKPSNLIRRQLDGKITVIDFGAVKGISNLAIERGQITQTRAIGTEGYMPAEQWKNQPKFNSDIYAVGIIGIQAIAGLDIEDIFHHKKTCESIWHYATPDRPIAQISDKLEKVLNKMVRYHFNDRYQCAAEVLQDLRSLTGSSSPPPTVMLSPQIVTVAAECAIVNESSAHSPPNPRLILPDGLSAGETILFTNSDPRLKQRGVGEFADSNSQQAFNLFKESWHKEYGKDHDDNKRWLFYWNHNGVMDQVWRFNVDYTKVSDSKYFTDLDSKYGSTTDGYATQKFSLGYANENWNATLSSKQFQIYDDTDRSQSDSYKVQPQLDLNYYKNDLGPFDFHIYGQAAKFTSVNPYSPDATRLHMEPTLSLPLTNGWASR